MGSRGYREPKYRCAVCGKGCSSKKELNGPHFVYDHEKARLHGYCYVGNLSWREDALWKELRESDVPMMIDAIPEKVCIHTVGARDVHVICNCDVVRFYDLIFTFWMTNESKRDYEAPVAEMIKIWLARISLDDEARSLYLILANSGLNSGELLERLADLFDLPRFWKQS